MHDVLRRMLYHFSEDPGITEFVPHVPVTSPGQRAAVWAIDGEHAPLYWFPRNCPRVAVWGRTPAECAAVRREFRTVGTPGGGSARLHVVERGWIGRLDDPPVYRYTFAADSFRPWGEASGQWVSDRTVCPLAVEPLGDPVALHAAVGIELRAVDNLWPVIDQAADGERGRWDFSIVRKHLAGPRRVAPTQS